MEDYDEGYTDCGAETGRCIYCGSEDVTEYDDGIYECMECGATWTD